MKKYLNTTILFLLVCLSLHSQERMGIGREKIKTLKIAYLTEELNLTSTEAEKFWPIYNTFDESIRNLRFLEHGKIRKKIKQLGSIDEISEEEAKTHVLQKSNIDRKIARVNDDFIAKISQFLSYKKILKFQIAEKEFGRKLLNKYKRNKLKNKQ